MQPRHGDSATFLFHSDFKDTILKASGRNSVFIKQASPAEELLLLWLEDGTDLVEATKMAEVDDALGVVRKGASNKPRFAVRFRDPEASSASKQQSLASVPRVKETVGMSPALGSVLVTIQSASCVETNTVTC